MAADSGEVETVLRVTPVFRKLAPQDLRTIAQAATIRHYDRAGIAAVRRRRSIDGISGAGFASSVKIRPMSPDGPLRFVTSADMSVEQLPWGQHEWLSRPGLTAARELLLVRVRMPPGLGHAFHRHPSMEEIIYVISGRAEQWVETTSHLLGPGETAHIPTNLVHATYNAGEDMLVFLAILSPATFDGPAIVDMSAEEPWASLRAAGGSTAVNPD